MAGSGSDSQESDPDLPSAQIEAMRRRLYAPGGSSREAVARYVAASGHEVMDGRRPSAGDDERGSAARGSTRGRRAVRLTLLRAALLVVLLAAALWWHHTRTALPDTLGPPATDGSTLLYYSRISNPASAPDKVTFEPADERMVFRADGHRLAVALRCVGEGSVRITVAEQAFSFRCDDHERTIAQQTRSGVHGPFFIFGRTVGNVVWGLRVTSLPLGDA